MHKESIMVIHHVSKYNFVKNSEDNINDKLLLILITKICLSYHLLILNQ